MIVHPCGCTTAIDPASGVRRKLAWCDGHAAERRDPATLGEDYYRECGALDEDAPARYVGELTEALGELPSKRGRAIPGRALGVALEIGCGASPYVGAIREAGWFYLGMDPSPWATDWVRGRFRASTYTGDFERSDFGRLVVVGRFGMILAAHALEHLRDAPRGIERCARLLRPGGELWIVVPDDSDPGNPDHLWFFTPETLRACVERAGLEVVREARRRYVEREEFLYLRARKPAQ